MPTVASVATRVPSHYYRQDTLASTFKSYCEAHQVGLDGELVDQLYQNSQIRGRYFAQPLDSFFDPPMHNRVNEASLRVAVDLAAEAVAEALDEAGLSTSDVRSITSLASTLIAIPTLETRVMNRLPFPPDLKRFPLNGLGCMGGAAGMARVNDYLVGHPEEVAVLLACEMGGTGIWLGGIQGYLQSVAESTGDGAASFSDLVSQAVTTALFGDGLAAAVCVGDRHHLAQAGGPRILGTRSVFVADTQEIMEVRVMSKGFMTALSADVPRHARDGIASVIEEFLGGHALGLDDIGVWMLHPGGPKVVSEIQEAFSLSDDDLRFSFDVLGEVGNVSAPTVLFVLDRAMRTDVPEGTYGLMVAMGPGFSEELVLFQW